MNEHLRHTGLPPDGWWDRIGRYRPGPNQTFEPLETREDREYALALTAAMQDSQPKVDGIVVGYEWAPPRHAARLKAEWEAWSAATGEPLPWTRTAQCRAAFVKPERPEYWAAAVMDHIARHYPNPKASP